MVIYFGYSTSGAATRESTYLSLYMERPHSLNPVGTGYRCRPLRRAAHVGRADSVEALLLSGTNVVAH
jgi:hypothetical protein